jgi:hypothetical protein
MKLMMPAPRPGHTLAIDIIGPLTPTTEGHTYILVAIDTFTRFPTCVPLKSIKAAEVAHALFRHVFAVHACFVRILTDCGTEFVNAGLKSFCETWGIHKLKSSPRHKEGNAHVERYIRWVNSAMTGLQIKFGNEWHNYIDACVFAYRVSQNESTGYSPFELTYGRQPIMPNEAILATDQEASFATEQEYAIHNSTWLNEAYSHVRNQQQRSADLNRDAAAQRSHLITYEEDDHVLYWQPQQRGYRKEILSKDDEKRDDTRLDVESDAPGKWRTRWTGPHRIVRRTGENTYTILEGNTCLERADVHVDTLWPFYPWSDEHPSTSPDIDKLVPWKTTGALRAGDLICVAMKRKTEFAIAKILVDACAGDKLSFQWMSNRKESWGKANDTFQLGWINKDRFYLDDPGTLDVRPYTGVDTKTSITSEFLLLQGFKLTLGLKLPAAVRRVIVKMRKEQHDMGAAAPSL